MDEPTLCKFYELTPSIDYADSLLKWMTPLKMKHGNRSTTANLFSDIILPPRRIPSPALPTLVSWQS